MIKSSRQDYIEASYMYVGAVLAVIFLSIIAVPLDVPRFGVVASPKETQPDVYDSSSFQEVEVHAKAYVVYDLVDKKVLASKNADTPLPLASLSKMMTTFTALSHYDKDSKIAIRPAAVGAGYDLGLQKNQSWKLGELLKYTLVFSSNDGAYAVADAFGGRKNFIELMNTDSALLGLSLIFTDPAGLDIGSSIGGVGTALDVAKLFAATRLRFPEIVEATTKARVTVSASTGKVIGIPNTNQDIVNFFGAEVSKTGFTDSAGGNLAIIVDTTLGHPVAMVILGSTREARFADMETLYRALLASSQKEE